jgi:hypothetical protein
MRQTRAAALTAVVTAAAVLASMPSEASTRAPRPAVAFDHPVANPYFPIEPGTVSVLKGSDEGQTLTDRVTVTHSTRVIQGVTTTVVRDVLRRRDGTVAEKTHDWYADDNDGNVWYFGERTATYDRHGHVTSREGSWEDGVDGATRGIIMPANPRVTDAYRQELYPGHAEDQAWIVQTRARTTVPYGHLGHLVRSFEWTRLEKDVISEKLYGRGLGTVRERDLSGGNETFRLVSVTRP